MTRYVVYINKILRDISIFANFSWTEIVFENILQFNIFPLVEFILPKLVKRYILVKGCIFYTKAIKAITLCLPILVGQK